MRADSKEPGAAFLSKSPHRFAICSLYFAASCLTLSLFNRDVANAQVDLSKLPPPASVTVEFSRDIEPILANSCLRCHGPEKPKSHFSLDNRTSLLKGGDEGIDVIPGHSAESHLIQYVAQLVPDMEMPPVDKGDPLTPAQIGLLRAWIDQGASWGTNRPADNFHYSLSPVIGGTAVSGNAAKFREQNWQADGPNGGLGQFDLAEQTSDNTKLTLSGHALADDYKLDLSVRRNDLGFIDSGWEQFRKYYDGTGGYDPLSLRFAPELSQAPFVDIGKIWVDVRPDPAKLAPDDTGF